MVPERNELLIASDSSTVALPLFKSSGLLIKQSIQSQSQDKTISVKEVPPPTPPSSAHAHAHAHARTHTPTQNHALHVQWQGRPK